MTDAALPTPKGKRLPHLDMLRGVAALLVAAGHARGMVFMDASQQHALPIVGKLFYAATSLGHQAVILFFALSGFLVGGSAFRQIWTGRWDVPGYWTRRVARLGTVLIPALVVTALCDWAGYRLGGPAFYDGTMFAQLASGPSLGNPADHSVVAFVGNILFLQTIAVPVFGSNGPLWSLANEFWYYLIFPLLLFAVVRRRPSAGSMALLLVAIALLLLLPFSITILGLIWVAGAGAMLAKPYVEQPIRDHPVLATLLMVPLLAAGVAASRLWPSIGSDIALGLAVCMILPILAELPSLGRAYGAIAFGTSEISFSLYSCHFPFAILIWLTWIGPAQSPFGAAGLIDYALLLAAILIFATLFWYATERHTLTVRHALDRLVQRARAAIARPA